MIRHIALFRWEPETTDDAIARLEAALATIPERVPTVRAYAFGRDLGLADGTYDFAVVGDFDDVDGYRTYADHPYHREILAMVRAMASEVARCQFSLDMRR